MTKKQMTENKRFTLEETDWSYRIRDSGAIMKIPKIVDMLNELADDNELLKQENRKLKEDLEHCANQFTNDGKNVLLSLR